MIFGYLYWSSRQFIKFTGACFEVTLSFLRRHPSTLVLGPVSLVPAACWAVLVSLCLYANQQRAAEIDDADEARMVQVKMLFLVLSLYWVWQYVASTVHVTVAGAFASWYFFGSRATSVVLSSLRRGFWSAGSVCLGSLIVAILQFIRNLVSRNGDGENFLAQLVRGAPLPTPPPAPTRCPASCVLPHQRGRSQLPSLPADVGALLHRVARAVLQQVRLLAITQHPLPCP